MMLSCSRIEAAGWTFQNDYSLKDSILFFYQYFLGSLANNCIGHQAWVCISRKREIDKDREKSSYYTPLQWKCNPWIRDSLTPIWGLGTKLSVWMIFFIDHIFRDQGVPWTRCCIFIGGECKKKMPGWSLIFLNVLRAEVEIMDGLCYMVHCQAAAAAPPRLNHTSSHHHTIHTAHIQTASSCFITITSHDRTRTLSKTIFSQGGKF